MGRLIDADDLIKRIAQIHGNLNTKNVGQAIDDTPDATPRQRFLIDENGKITPLSERKKGKWIKNDFYEDALMCSCCRAYLDKEDWSRHYFYFCYHCGAFMEGMDCGADMREEKTDEQEIH